METTADLNIIKYHWSFNGSIKDEVENLDLTKEGNDTLWTEDRFGRNNMALKLRNFSNFFRIPNDIYMSNAFSVSVWLRVHECSKSSRLIDFSHQTLGHNIIFGYHSINYNCLPYLEVFKEKSLSCNLTLDKEFPNIQINTWNHLSFSFNEQNQIVYLNALPIINRSLSCQVDSSVLRNLNYIFKINDNHYEDVNFDIDDLKIYNRALTQKQIQTDLNM